MRVGPEQVRPPLSAAWHWSPAATGWAALSLRGGRPVSGAGCPAREDALALLAEVLGEERVLREADAEARLVELCGRMPSPRVSRPRT